MSDPAFLFYPGDYLRDTQCLSPNCQVVYDRIMCEHMRNICISQSRLNFFTKRLTPGEVEEVMSVLTKVDDGYQIEWVALSIIKRKAYSSSRSENRKGKGKNISISYDNHMENEIVNENTNGIDNDLGNKTGIEKNEEPPVEDLFPETATEPVFHPLFIHARNNYPTLFKLKVPLTNDNILTLIGEGYPEELIIEKMEGLENKRDALKQYKNALLTLRNWCKNGSFNNTTAAKRTTRSGSWSPDNPATRQYLEERRIELKAQQEQHNQQRYSPT